MPIEVRIIRLKDFDGLINTYLRDYLKAPVKEFMDMFFTKYIISVKKFKYTDIYSDFDSFKLNTLEIEKTALLLNIKPENIFYYLFMDFLEALKNDEIDPNIFIDLKKKTPQEIEADKLINELFAEEEYQRINPKEAKNLKLSDVPGQTVPLLEDIEENVR